MATCKTCRKEFQLRVDHRGYANVCVDCSKGDVDRVMGKVAWSGKHCMEMEVTSNRAEAIYFNGRQKRLGAGVMRSLCESKAPRVQQEICGKRGSGAEGGAMYFSSLGEKRTIKW